MAKTTTKRQARARKASGKTAVSRVKPKAKVMAKLQPRARKTSGKSAVLARAKPKARGKQTFNVNHLRAEDFRTDGLRTYARYRDLGMSKATDGQLQAHVIRLTSP